MAPALIRQNYLTNCNSIIHYTPLSSALLITLNNEKCTKKYNANEVMISTKNEQQWWPRRNLGKSFLTLLPHDTHYKNINKNDRTFFLFSSFVIFYFVFPFIFFFVSTVFLCSTVWHTKWFFLFHFLFSVFQFTNCSLFEERKLKTKINVSTLLWSVLQICHIVVTGKIFSSTSHTVIHIDKTEHIIFCRPTSFPMVTSYRIRSDTSENSF